MPMSWLDKWQHIFVLPKEATYEKHWHIKCHYIRVPTYTTIYGGSLDSLCNDGACISCLEAFPLSKHENFLYAQGTYKNTDTLNAIT